MLNEREAAAVSHDEVIQNADVDQSESIPEPLRDDLVRLARLEDAGRVVMRKDERRGVVEQRLAHDFPGMHDGAVEGAAEELLESDQAVPGIQVEAAKDLVGSVT